MRERSLLRTGAAYVYLLKLFIHYFSLSGGFEMVKFEIVNEENTWTSIN